MLLGYKLDGPAAFVSYADAEWSTERVRISKARIFEG